jgi:16S rRNA (uracil1498-N3)-methyltransferase
MRLTRVYVNQSMRVGTHVRLPENAAAHLSRVLRLREGDVCVLFNGDGNDYDATLLATDKRGVDVEVLAARAIDNESPLRIVLLQGIARGDKMDLILQKATELGVRAIAPVFADRTEVRLDGDRLDKRVAHWRSVVISACEQSGRARIPDVFPPRGLAEAVGALDPDMLKLTLDPFGEHRFATLAMPPAGAGRNAGNSDRTAGDADIVVAIGPEGGWSDKDREILRGTGFAGLRLGPRVLRTETAGLAAIAALQAMFGDW